jgi:hypothetical protein
MSRIYVIHLRPLPSDVPEALRIRRLLKTALRVHRLRCVDIRELPAKSRKRKAA